MIDISTQADIPVGGIYTATAVKVIINVSLLSVISFSYSYDVYVIVHFVPSLSM
jgi:hypothetical protein